MNAKTNTIMYARLAKKDPQPVSNFIARIVKEANFVDPKGSTIERLLKIEGQCGVDELPQITVKSTELANAEWPHHHWGYNNGIEVYPIHNAPKHLQSAVRRESSDIKSFTFINAMGFCRVAGRYVYATNNRSITESGSVSPLRSRMKRPLDLYEIRKPTKNRKRLKKAFFELLRILDISETQGFVGVLLLASMFRPVLNIYERTDILIWLIGPSGAFKSTIAALAMCFYGERFDAKSLTANWLDSLASLEEKLSVVRQALICVDDYLEEGPNASSYRSKAHTIIRMIGDGTPKGKMLAVGNLKDGELLTALPLITAEKLPRHLERSALNRCVLCSIHEGEIDIELLTTLQASAGHGVFSQVAANYIQYVMKNGEECRQALYDDYRDERPHFERVNNSRHLRQPENLTSIMVAVKSAFRFALAEELIPLDQCMEYEDRCRTELLQLASMQAGLHHSTPLVDVFMQQLYSAFLQGSCHARIYPNGSPPSASRAPQLGWSDRAPGGLHIGWYDPGKELLYFRIADEAIILRFLRGLDRRLTDDRHGIGQSLTSFAKFLIDGGIYGGGERSRETYKLRKTPLGENGGKQSVIAILFPLN